MNHPTPEEWMSFLYRETDRGRREQLRSHLKSCAACRSQLQIWRGSIKALEQWPNCERQPSLTWPMLLKAAAVVAFLVAVGFGWGRFSTPSPSNLDSLRAELAKQLEQRLAAAKSDWTEQMRQEQREVREAASLQMQRLLTDYAGAAETKRMEDYETLLTAFRRLEAERRADYATLRKELETVAVMTQASFQNLVAVATPPRTLD